MEFNFNHKLHINIEHDWESSVSVFFFFFFINKNQQKQKTITNKFKKLYNTALIKNKTESIKLSENMLQHGILYNYYRLNENKITA